MFSQELLTNGELNHFSLKERMVEIGKRWQKLSQSQKDKYKKLVEEQQVEYKAELEAWVKVRHNDSASADKLNISKRFVAPCWSLICPFPSSVSVSSGPRRLQGDLVFGESLTPPHLSVRHLHDSANLCLFV